MEAFDQWWNLVAGSSPDIALDPAAWVSAVKAIDTSDGNAEVPSRIIDAMFAMIDTDGSGTLDQAEFARIYDSAGASRQQALDAFAVLDRDGDGVIDIQEFSSSDDPQAPGNWLLGRP
ncbi:EF-hand domain-containing protein [Nonomuraea sp. PA05]|uniref:EF-hand domain-containing protein n=1 Tax=Nonomuraea sp. PA05 TaxID=2604466 RepID=UPI0011D40312|nr:EF-hand domain-containing protein [Nonomuraea sp. PA05]TYB62216.1 EF-hand domain-containing protein [Nonomuraea sp. PA05]